ncbi:glycosyltransferase family 2 protein [Halomarina ordinaria]|uniref:Glycosyltransferase family 2 protein n=1 Tax=Halomarina ordinaria TaxID=3033939 RepID=A0ABD5U6U7_9EURY|nr:glycosyltransferase family 2 protein [Halomarina sp. PSRA2]
MSVATAALRGVFLVSSAVVAWVYALYPVTLAVAAALVGSPTRSTDDLPSVTLVVAAYNEVDVIAAKLENCLALSYPEDRLDVVVFSDASSDGTDRVVRSYADRGVDLVRVEGRVGKTACQNRVVADLETDLVVFSDANSLYDPDALRELVAGFDDGVGCVVGELRYEAAGGVDGESLYWRYARFLKRAESRLGSTVKGNGAIYAVRREAYVPLPPEAMSDFAEPLSVRRAGWRVVYRPGAVAREHTAPDVAGERTRKVRIMARSWQTVGSYLDLLDPRRYGGFSVAFLTDTVLWWTTPLFGALSLASGTLLALRRGSRAGVAVALAGAGGLALAAVGALGERLDRPAPTVCHLAHYFLVGNYAIVAGFVRYARGERVVVWETGRERADATSEASR